MFKKRKNNNANQLNIIFDIRSSSVGVALWKYLKGKPTIIYTDRQYIMFENKQETDDFIDNIYRTLDQIMMRVFRSEISQQNNLSDIDKIMCVFSHPWYRADIKNINSKEKKSRKFTDKYLEDRLSLKEDENPEETEIENEIISIYLNGYEVNEPKNKEFKEIDVSSYRSVISKQTKREIKDKIRDKFKRGEISFHSNPFAIMSVLRNTFHSLNNFSLFNVGGEATEVLNFSNESIRQLLTIPNGFNYLIRELSVTIKENKNNTFSKIKLLTENEIQDDKLKSQIVEIAKKWFKDINENVKIKQNIFIIVDKDFGKIVKDIFSDKDFYSKTLKLGKEPTVRVITSRNTENLALYKENVERDPLLSTLLNFQQLLLDKIC